MKLTKSRLKRLIKEELQKVLMQEQCPPGMTQQGSQCVGQPGEYKKPTITQTSQGAPIEMPAKDKPARNETDYARSVAVPLCQARWSIRDQKRLFDKAGYGRWTVKQLIKTVRGTNGKNLGLQPLMPGMRNDLASCKRFVGTARPRRAKPMNKWDCAKICSRANSTQAREACKKCMQATK